MATISALNILKRLEKSHATPKWLKILYEAWNGSLPWLVGVFGFLLSAETLIADFFLQSPDKLIKIRSIYLVCAITWLIFCWKKLFISKGPFKKGKLTIASDKALMFAGEKLTSISLIIISGLMILQVLGIPTNALLAYGGIGGLAISWAGKDIVANLFGGLMIYIQRPFSVGDWIFSPNKNFEGTVEDIGWYMTRIRTFDRRPTYIPNALITDAIIENPERMYNRRIKATFGIRYQDISKTQAIVDDIEKMLKNHPEIDQQQILMVHLINFGPHSLDIEVYTFTKTTAWKKWRDIQQQIFLTIAKIITSHGAEIAFPTTTIHWEESQTKEGKKPTYMTSIPNPVMSVNKV